uniref:Uncharacterized protein LOC111102523 n=1 Tax=Crassostrea virginica TaxID=6565 RepID=A0A8B8AIC0_CRAVI|nr:uncharacterized protein LOC111102523 [Crassostrea virginica]
MVIFLTLIGVDFLILCMDLQVKTSSGCVQGFFGENCELPCRYPNYGQDCQLECVCTMELCNHISGCPKPATETTTDSKSYGSRSVPDDTRNLKIFYTSNFNLTLGEEILQTNGLDLKHKAMLVSICIMATVILVLAGVYLTKRTTISAIISYYSFFRQNK